jgi:hypothetical protein
MTMSTTGIRYSAGEAGIWFLSVYEEKHRSGHPMGHQKSEVLGDTLRILQKQVNLAESSNSKFSLH